MRNRWFQILVIGIIGLGILLRASKYLPAWSMRGDELSLTSNLMNRSPLELISKPLDFEQAAPFGFLLIEKFLLTVLGRSEYVLRLVPFLAGCASLFLLQRLLSKPSAQYGNLFALGAFAFGDYLIYYSAEIKQYSTDVLICLVLFLILQRHLANEHTTTDDMLWLAGAGVFALCFSHPAVFILGGIGIALFAHHFKDKRRLVWVIITSAVWAVTFLIVYLLILRHQTTSSYLITFWGNLLSFMPMPPWQDLSWFPSALDNLFFVVGGLASGLIIVFPIYLLGLWGFVKEKNWGWALALTVPIGLNMLASGFQKFPFHGRLILYLLPLIFITLGKGIDALLDKIPSRVIANFVYGALVILILNSAVPTANTYLVTRDYVRDDMKPALSFMKLNAQGNDLVYLYHYAGGTYTYYAPDYGLENLAVIHGEDRFRNAKRYDQDLDLLPRGQRVWFVFSFVGQTRVSKDVKVDEREYILNYLNQNGKLMTEFYSTNNASYAHLFILR